MISKVNNDTQLITHVKYKTLNKSYLRCDNLRCLNLFMSYDTFYSEDCVVI